LPQTTTENSASLNGKLALITGAQQGIGAAIALELVEQCGVKCHLLGADLSDPQQLHELITDCDAIGSIDILVNNAAIFPRAEFLTVTDELWDDVHAVNLKAPFTISRHVANQMVANGVRGSIINIVSGAAFRGTPRGSHYVASKAGLLGLTRAMAQELAVPNIRVNAVAPGLTDTAQPRYGMSEQDLIDAAVTIPLGRIAAPEDVAPAVRFLASDESRYMTGQTLHVNGGSYLS